MERAGGEEGAESPRRSQGPHRAVQSGAAGRGFATAGGGLAVGGIAAAGGLRVRKFCVEKGCRAWPGQPAPDGGRVAGSPIRRPHREAASQSGTRAPAQRRCLVKQNSYNIKYS